MSGKYKVRFHLGRGENYRHWQIIRPDGEREFVKPSDDTQIRMWNCRLVNRGKTAKKIYDGNCNKTVCSWIECEKLEVKGILGSLFSDDEKDKFVGYEKGVRLEYNPRKNPFWVDTATNSNVDGKFIKEMFTYEYGVFRRK